MANESGEFAFEGLADGKYEIRASHVDYKIVATSLVRLFNGHQEPSSVVVTMSAGDGSVWGQITGTDGAPLVGIEVRISSGSCSASCRSDQDGCYTFTGLPPGPHVMTIGRDELKDREYLFSLRPSQQLRYDIATAGTATVKGDIRTGAHGKLAERLHLVLRSPALTLRSQEHRRLATNRAKYEFGFLPPGTYELEVLSDMLGNRKFSFSLSSGETKVLDINLGRHGSLKGRVIGTGGEPLAGVQINVSSAGSDVQVTDDREGCYFVKDVSPGHVYLAISEGRFSGTWYEFELKEEEDKEFDLDFSTIGDVRGQLLKADGEPLGLAALRVESPHRSVEVITDREGRFRAEGLFPGQCRIHLPVPHLGRAYTLELAPREQKELKILLPP